MICSALRERDLTPDNRSIIFRRWRFLVRHNDIIFFFLLLYLRLLLGTELVLQDVNSRYPGLLFGLAFPHVNRLY